MKPAMKQLMLLHTDEIPRIGEETFPFQTKTMMKHLVQYIDINFFYENQ